MMPVVPIRALLACLLCTALAAAHGASGTPLVYTYSHGDEWFASRGLVIDDGKQVTIVGATSSYTSARRLIATVRRSTSSAIQRVILDSSRPGAAGGIAAFAEEGIDIWASRRVERGLRETFPYYAAKRGDPHGSILRAARTPITTFDERMSFQLTASGAIEVIDLPHGCNANGNSMVRLRTDRPITYVGSLVQAQHHPWLSGPISDGLPMADLPAWRHCIQLLREAGQFEHEWYTDEGDQGSGDGKVAAFIEYLDFVEGSLQKVFADRLHARQSFNFASLPSLAAELAAAIARRFPERRGDLADLHRALIEVLHAEVVRRTERGLLGPRA